MGSLEEQEAVSTTELFFFLPLTVCLTFANIQNETRISEDSKLTFTHEMKHLAFVSLDLANLTRID